MNEMLEILDTFFLQGCISLSTILNFERTASPLYPLIFFRNRYFQKCKKILKKKFECVQKSVNEFV